MQSIRLEVPAESNLRGNTIADTDAGIKGMAGLSEDISEEFHYLRFFPKNMEESAALLDYDVFPIPFDAEVVSPGYLNRETNGGIPSYYGLVRTDRELPDVEYEIISTLKLVCRSDGAATTYFTPEQWQKKV